jgi:predicted PurR-regulated permease PerM
MPPPPPPPPPSEPGPSPDEGAPLPPIQPDAVDERAFLEAAKAKEEAEAARKEAEALQSKNATLQAQIDELKAFAARQHPDEAPPKDLQRLHLLQIQPVRDVLVILLVLGIFWLGYILSPITVPMLLALTLAYLVEPVVRRLVRGKHMTRVQAAASVIMIVVILITVPLVVGTTLAVSQGVRTTQTVSRNVEAIQRLVENPADEDAKAQLKGAWKVLGEFVAGVANPTPTPEEIEAQKKKDEEAAKAKAAEESQEQGPPAPGAEPNPAPEGSTPSQDTGNPTTPSPTTAPAGGTTPAANGSGQSVAEAAKPGGGIATRAATWISSAFENNLQSLGRFAARYLVGTSSDAVDIGVKAVKAVFLLVFGLFLVLFFFFFFCVSYESVTNRIANMIPKWKRNRTLELLKQMDAVIAAFVRGRLIIMGILMVLFTLGYFLIGVPAPLIVGPITGILAVVPYLGMISIPASMLLMWLQPVGPQWQQTWWWIVIAPVVLYFLIQTVEDYVLTPIIQGKATQMDTPSILFAVIAGGILAGFYGVLLAIPAAACIKILLRESFWPRFQAWAEGRVKDFLPISRYDPTEAALTPLTPPQPPPPSSK